MNLIQTLYIDTQKNPFKDSFGWVAPEYHLMGWALSCLQLHKIYGNISLFANSPGAHLLIDTLQLPYSEVHLSHDQLTLIHPNLWALPKIYTYSLQKQPFLHIDGDVFLFQPFNADLLRGELIAQNMESTTGYSAPVQEDLMRYFIYLPPCVKKDFESKISAYSVNAGILGGNNVSFFHDYTALAFDYIHNNTNQLQHINVDHFNVFFEQHLFYALAKEKNIPVNVLFESVVNDNEYQYLGDFQEVTFKRNYLHLLGHFKRDEFTCIQMAAKLRELYPDYYDRIIALFHKKNLRLSPCGFTNGVNPLSRRTNTESNTHLWRLQFVAKYCPPDIEKELFQHDFDMFYQQLISLLENEIDGLHERDVAAQCWYRDLFANPSVILDQSIVRCQEMGIIESSFDWAGLFNKHYRVGVEYYSDLPIYKGCFFNLVVYEDSDNGFSLYDINELDHAMLLLLCEPLSIRETMIKMQVYFEDEVLQNHYKVYQDLIIKTLKRLVTKKAIQIQ